MNREFEQASTKKVEQEIRRKNSETIQGVKENI